MSAPSRPDWVVRTLVTLLGAGVLMLALQEGQGEGLDVGTPAPDFAFTTVAGETSMLAALKGQVVVVAFWATWCPPCREELPALKQLAAEYAGRGVRLLAANEEGTPEDAQHAVEAWLRDDPALRPYVVFAERSARDAYRLRVLPTLYVIDPRGRVTGRASGPRDVATVRRWVDEALR